MEHMLSTPRTRFSAVLAIVATALGIGVAVATPAAATVTTSAPIAQAVLKLLNQERAANRLPALKSNTALQRAAHSHNLAMDKHNTMSHQLPGEPPFYTRISNAGYKYSSCGENIAWNSDVSQTGATNEETAMYNEKAPNNGHRLNILSKTFVDVGIDVVIDSSTHKLWLTEDFGRHS
jgi:uncharacterized protein YkwD